jgi:hypothetical protein
MSKIVENTTCFAEHKCRNLKCEKRSCRNWFDSEQDLNCAVLAADKGSKTLQEIGDFFDLTRMRICQIEKNLVEKLKNNQEVVKLD